MEVMKKTLTNSHRSVLYKIDGYTITKWSRTGGGWTKEIEWCEKNVPKAEAALREMGFKDVAEIGSVGIMGESIKRLMRGEWDGKDEA